MPMLLWIGHIQLTTARGAVVNTLLMYRCNYSLCRKCLRMMYSLDRILKLLTETLTYYHMLPGEVKLSRFLSVALGSRGKAYVLLLRNLFVVLYSDCDNVPPFAALYFWLKSCRKKTLKKSDMGKHIKWWCFHDHLHNLIVSEMLMHLKTTERSLFSIFMPDVTEKWKNVTKL